MGTATRRAARNFSVSDEIVEVPLSRLLPGDSPRSAPSAIHVHTLAAIQAPLPPIIVARASMRVIDGLHRLRAAELRGDKTIEVRFFDGAEGDAFVFAVRSNSAHGLPLTLADRKTAALRIIEFRPEWSDRSVAAAAGVSDKTVAALRARSNVVSPFERLGSDGRFHRSNRVAGRLRAAEMFTADPGASVVKVARAAGISVTTAKDVRSRLRRGADPVPNRHQDPPPGRTAQPRPAIDRRSAVQRLRSDPSMRFSETGRTLLRRLDGPGLDRTEWETLASNIPGHCTHTVAELARMCAEDWQRFAAVVDSRTSTAC